MADTPAADTPAAAPPPPVAEEGVKRAAPGDDAPKPRLPTKPLKKNVSSFLHFCAEQREAVKAEQPDAAIGQVSKLLGERWKALDGDAKARYNEMAAADKRRYDAEKQAQGPVTKQAKQESQPHETIIPVARVKKICRADPEIRSMAKEATVVLAKAAEIFVQILAKATHACASSRTLRADHVAQAVRDRPDFAFLRVEFPRVDYKPTAAGPKKGLVKPENQPTISSFFAAKKEPTAEGA